MNYISVAKETKRITKEGNYKLDGTMIYLPDLDYTDVTVYSPEMGEKLLNAHVPGAGSIGKISALWQKILFRQQETLKILLS